MLNKPNILNLLFQFPIVFLLASCANSPTVDPATVFRYNESKGIATLDPAFASNKSIIWPVNQIFNGLVQLDEHLNILPCIARNWEISGSGTCYIFNLRQDVFFHDHGLFPTGKGRKVVAGDFVFSLNRISDPLTASPGAWIFKDLDRTKGFDSTGLEATSDSTLKIYIKNPFPAFLGLLSMTYCSVLPKEIVGFYGKDFREHPVGTGPFYFKLWKDSEKLILRKNNSYFEKDGDGNPLPSIEAVSITFIRDKQSEFLEFVKGNIDFISGLHASYKDELMTKCGTLNPKYNKKLNMIAQPYLNTEYLGFLLDENLDIVKDSPLANLKVRQAINYGFDRKKMVTYLRNNMGTPAHAGFVPDGLPSFHKDSVQGFSYRPDYARQLLAEAGYPNGEGLPEITLTTNSDYLDLCEYIQHELSDLGIRINIEIGTGVSFREMVSQSKLNFFRGSWIADYPDAQNYLALFYSKNFCPSGPNYTHYRNVDFDLLYEKAMNESCDSTRFIYYRKLDQMIIDEAVIVPLFYDRVVRFVQKEVMGLGSNPMNILNLKYVRKSK